MTSPTQPNPSYLEMRDCHGQPWLFCTLCNRWVDDKHLSCPRHMKNVERHLQEHNQDQQVAGQDSEQVAAACHYIKHLRELVDTQEYSRILLIAFIENALQTEVLVKDRDDIPLHSEHGAPYVPFVLHKFGSHMYGLPLPSSDVDLVCVLPDNLESYRLSGKLVLERILKKCKGFELCTGVVNATKFKSTVELRCANLRVDFTIHVGDVMKHRPSALSRHLGEWLDRMPSCVRDFCLLAVDWAKQCGACYNRKGTIKNLLKGVHWALLALAYYMYQASQGCSALSSPAPGIDSEAAPLRLLKSMLEFYKAFEFEHFSICPLTMSNPFPARSIDSSGSTSPLSTMSPQNEAQSKEKPAASSPLVHLCDPQDSTRNLAENVDAESLAQIREKLVLGTQRLACRGFWEEAQKRWDAYTTINFDGMQGPEHMGLRCDQEGHTSPQ